LHAHASQVLKNGLVDLEAVEAQARYRGFQARVKLAEAFEVERFLWDLRQPSMLATATEDIHAKAFALKRVS
jgi:IS5 family transposase